MRKAIILLLCILAIFFLSLSLAQENTNGFSITNSINVANSTNLTNGETVPDTASEQTFKPRFKHLSVSTSAKSKVLGKNLVSGYKDVTQTQESTIILGHSPATFKPSVNVSITSVNNATDKWVEVTNQEATR